MKKDPLVFFYAHRTRPQLSAEWNMDILLYRDIQFYFNISIFEIDVKTGPLHRIVNIVNFVSCSNTLVQHLEDHLPSLYAA